MIHDRDPAGRQRAKRLPAWTWTDGARAVAASRQDAARLLGCKPSALSKLHDWEMGQRRPDYRGQALAMANPWEIIRHDPDRGWELVPEGER